MKIFSPGMALLAMVILFTSCTDKEGSRGYERKRPVIQGVTAEEVKMREVPVYAEAVGTLLSRNSALVSAKVMGEVREIQVKAGDRVKKGDPLLVIHSPDSNARVLAAKEAWEEAKRAVSVAGEKLQLEEKTFERFQKLQEARAVTGQEFDQVEAGREVARLQHERALNSLSRAKASLQEAEAFQKYSMIVSPLSGIVAEKYIDAGSMALPGAPLFSIEKSDYRVEVPVDEGLITLIHAGMPVDIIIDSLNATVRGSVGEIVHQVDTASRTFTVKIDLDSQPDFLRGGIYARARFPSGRRQGLYIPEDSLLIRGELRGVYVVNDEGMIAFRLVKTGKTENAMIEIRSGLAEGERIIVEGIGRAVDGAILQPRE